MVIDVTITGKERNALLEKILDKYIKQIVNDSKHDVHLRETTSTLLVLSEGYSLLSNKIELDELIYQNMLNIKKSLIENELYYSPSLFGGLTEVAFSIYAVYKSTGHYKKFLDKINQLLLEWTENFLGFIDIKDNLSADFFDAIFGVSGILKYLLLFAEEEQVVELIKRLLRMLVYLSGYEKEDLGLLPRWYVRKDNLRMEANKLNYPTGSINLGLSHGIAGPLVVLSEAYKKGIIVDGHLDAIHNIVSEYKKFTYLINDSTYWPTMLSPEHYLTDGKDFNKEIHRESWCYGAISTAKVLFTTGNCISDHDLSDWAFDIIEQKAQLELKDLLLDSPTLCHGYAGVLCILNSVFNIRKSAALQLGINKTEKQILKMYDQNSQYGFWDIEGSDKEDRNTFLNGSAGVILTLLSANGYGNNIIMNKLML
ncbi:lanthionine synthetase C family protein [Paenibacillus sp. FSL F4-0236]|uniref:lanthionine synthetase C family protein n=1 Tax=Paenibacillus sp. FSL F4-0236 TaxID=2954731 RepID=UPI0030F951C6